jgi:hypothetical protein
MSFKIDRNTISKVSDILETNKLPVKLGKKRKEHRAMGSRLIGRAKSEEQRSKGDQ